MQGYADTGFLCSLYCKDANSVDAVRRMERQTLPLPVTWLHALEFRNVLRLRVFRKEITGTQHDASLNAFLSDLAGGNLSPTDPEAGSLRTESERLSALHTPTLGVRSLDILHVASALVLGLPEFLSFDRRQVQLANAAGLRVPSL
jgi:predicted nucleic acid-binding protein